jgi:hypothetical protein
MKRDPRGGAEVAKVVLNQKNSRTKKRKVMRLA